MRTPFQYLILCLLMMVAIGQTGTPAFLLQLWAKGAMYERYLPLMEREDAIQLVLRGDFGCGYFDELKAVEEASELVTQQWFVSKAPLLLLPVPSGPIAVAHRSLKLCSADVGTGPLNLEETLKPPPRAV